MSSLGIYQPAPVSVPFSGTTDASGNFTLTKQVRASYWSLVKVVALAAGNGAWAVTAAGGIPLDFANGPRCSVGPFIVAPGDELTVSVFAATPSATVQGNIIGKQFPDQASAAEALVLTSNPLSVSTTSPIRVVAKLAVPGNGGSVSTVLPISADILGIGYLRATDASSIALIQITGNNSNGSYILTNTAPLRQRNEFDPVDTSVTVTVTTNVGSIATTVWILAYSADPIASIDNVAGGLLNVTFGTSSPAVWQAADNFVDVPSTNIANNATLTLIAGVALKSIYLHHYWFSQDAAGAQWQLETTGPVGSIANFITPNARGLIASGDARGPNITANAGPGVGVAMRNLSGGASFLAGFVSFVQR